MGHRAYAICRRCSLRVPVVWVHGSEPAFFVVEHFDLYSRECPGAGNLPVPGSVEVSLMPYGVLA